MAVDRGRYLLPAGVALVLVAAAISNSLRGDGDDGDDAGESRPRSRVDHPEPPDAEVVLAAGDIADCGSDGDEATAELLGENAGSIVALGDLAYDDGSRADFADCYRPTWGRFRTRTKPTPGNHEYHTPGAAGYFDYFGAAAGHPGEGWYSFDLGSWHLIALNSNCAEVGGCEPGSAQEQWLRRDLAQNTTQCTLAYWHHPRFSSGTEHGNNDDVAPLWNALYEARADIVLSGHEHNYERFAPMDRRGRPEIGRGVREFVVGTGGRSHYEFGQPLPGSQFRDDESFGILRLVLRDTRYDWTFLTTDDAAPPVDAGSGRCQ